MTNKNIRDITAGALMVGAGLISGCKNLPIVATLKNQPVRVVDEVAVEWDGGYASGDLIVFQYLDKPGITKSFITEKVVVDSLHLGKDYIIDANILAGKEVVYLQPTKIDTLGKEKADSILKNALEDTTKIEQTSGSVSKVRTDNNDKMFFLK